MYEPRHAGKEPPGLARAAARVPYARTRAAIFAVVAFTWITWWPVRDHVLRHTPVRIDSDISDGLSVVAMTAAVVGLGLYRGAHEIIVRQVGELGQWMREHERANEIAGRPRRLKVISGGGGDR